MLLLANIKVVAWLRVITLTLTLIKLNTTVTYKGTTLASPMMQKLSGTIMLIRQGSFTGGNSHLPPLQDINVFFSSRLMLAKSSEPCFGPVHSMLTTLTLRLPPNPVYINMQCIIHPQTVTMKPSLPRVIQLIRVNREEDSTGIESKL